MISVRSPHNDHGIRPINLRTDLASLADLIELVFADSMDSSGRDALREMRYLSKMGAGLHVLSRMNEMAFGISQGYVWVEAGELVGNVSIYPANWPADLGSAWIIANVGVHPDYQRRGIARQLMQVSLQAVKERGGTTAILQVDADNMAARNLYRSLGFIDERTWITWRRRSSSVLPAGPPEQPSVYIRHRRRTEWKAEMALVERIRPQKHGGIGWLRPFHISQFRKPSWGKLLDWINFRSTEHLVIRQGNMLAAALWIENNFGSKTRLTLLVEPHYQGIYDDFLLNTVVRRLNRTPLIIEHPADELAINKTLKKYSFIPQREVIHMRWDVR